MVQQTVLTPTILLFDTSTPHGCVVLGQGSRVLASDSWTVSQGHTAELLPRIETVLKKSKIELSDLNAITIGIGPGSFTGLRVTLATAKGLCLGQNLPLIAIPSLELVAAAPAPGLIAATCDAFRGEIYLGVYRHSNGRPVLQGEIRSLTPQAASAEIEKHEEPVTLRGTGYLRYTDTFNKCRTLIAPNSNICDLNSISVRHLLDPAAVLALAQSYYTAQDFCELATILPLYVRRAEAEEKRDRAGA